MKNKKSQKSKILNFTLSFYILVFAFCILVFAFFILVNKANAATLCLEPSAGQYQPGDTFMIGVKLDSQGKSINAVEVGLTFSKDILEVKDFSTGNSILTLWVEKPSFSNQEGKISFIGGIPGSYSGEDGLLGKIVFKVRKINETKTAEVKFLDNSKVLLDDHKGTEADLSVRGAVFKILPRISRSVKKEWEENFQEDKIPPEPFRIKISKDPLIFNGKYFIVFSTTDKQSGIDHYEVKEGKRDWKITDSPYLLENQSLGEEIKVKAIDKAGNERIQMIKFKPKEVKKEIDWKNILFWVVLIIILGGGIWRIIKLWKRRKIPREI